MEKPKCRCRDKTPTFSILYIGMNLGYEPFAKSEVRDAIRYAIDQEGIVNNILQGMAIKAQTFIPKGMFGYNPAMPYTLNLEKAKKLLTDAGYPNGFDVELLCTSSSTASDIAAKIQSDLAKIGINVNITKIVAAQFFKQVRARSFQISLLDWGSDYIDPDANAKPFAHSNSIGDDAKIKQLAWFNRYVNLETSKLVEEGLQELDPEKRAAIYKKITDIILDDGPYAILYSPIALYGIRSNVKNFVASPSFFLYDFSTLKKE